MTSKTETTGSFNGYMYSYPYYHYTPTETNLDSIKKISEIIYKLSEALENIKDPHTTKELEDIIIDLSNVIKEKLKAN